MESSVVQAPCLINKGQFHKTIHESPAERGHSLQQKTAEWLAIGIDRNVNVLPSDCISDDDFADHGTQRTTCEALPGFSRICSSIDFMRLYSASCKSRSRSRRSTRSNFSIDIP
jgi:hypothetical protein